MNRNLLIFGLIFVTLILVALVSFGSFQQIGINAKKADIHGHTIQLEIADTQEKWQKGLSNRTSLPESNGMLFLFPSKSVYQFWMKGMQFPIDIVFLNDTKVVTIYSDVQPQINISGTKSPNLTLYAPTEPANRVVELNAGQAKKFGLKEGEQVKFSL